MLVAVSESPQQVDKVKPADLAEQFDQFVSLTRDWTLEWVDAARVVHRLPVTQ